MPPAAVVAVRPYYLADNETRWKNNSEPSMLLPASFPLIVTLPNAPAHLLSGLTITYNNSCSLTNLFI